jgi:hypothetical protein
MYKLRKIFENDSVQMAEVTELDKIFFDIQSCQFRAEVQCFEEFCLHHQRMMCGRLQYNLNLGEIPFRSS